MLRIRPSWLRDILATDLQHESEPMNLTPIGLHDFAPQSTRHLRLPRKATKHCPIAALGSHTSPHWSTQGMWMSQCALLLQIHPKAVFDLQVGSTKYTMLNHVLMHVACGLIIIFPHAPSFEISVCCPQSTVKMPNVTAVSMNQNTPSQISTDKWMYNRKHRAQEHTTTPPSCGPTTHQKVHPSFQWILWSQIGLEHNPDTTQLKDSASRTGCQARSRTNTLKKMF